MTAGEGKIKMVSLISTHKKRPRSRIVLFSYGGKAVSKKQTRVPAGNKENNAAAAKSNIIDYATLLSMYYEHNKAATASEDAALPGEYAQKQKRLKYMML